jgi:hypothetical protein
MFLRQLSFFNFLSSRLFKVQYFIAHTWLQIYWARAKPRFQLTCPVAFSEILRSLRKSTSGEKVYRSRYSCSLRAVLPLDRIPVMGARSSLPVQTDPGTQPASFTMGTGSFSGVNRQGCGVDHLSSSIAEIKGRIELYYTPTACLRTYLRICGEKPCDNKCCVEFKTTVRITAWSAVFLHSVILQMLPLFYP